MKKFNTTAIILSRTNFGEADRILTFLTPDHGKVHGLARGVRRQKSKLAGGLELFSISDVSFLIGRGEVYTIASTRLVKHYGQIVKNIDRTNAGYDFIKLLNKNTEDQPEPAYFDLLKVAFEALDKKDINLDLIQLWFKAQLLRLAGHTPNLRTDENGQKLVADKKYIFDLEAMGFKQSSSMPGSFSTNHIKFLRLIFSDNSPPALQKLKDVQKFIDRSHRLMATLSQGFHS